MPFWEFFSHKNWAETTLPRAEFLNFTENTFSPMISTILQKKIVDYLRHYKPTRVGIFGSYARNQQRQESDLDILVNFEKTVNLLDIVGIEMDLTDILGIKVDLVSEKSILPAMRPYIEKDLHILL